MARKRKIANSGLADAFAGSAPKKTCHVGDVLSDGWVVGPVSPETGTVMAIEPASGAPDGYRTWHEGQDHAAALRGKGHVNARLPSEGELKAIYNQVVKAELNGNARFNTSRFVPYGKYWSSTTDRQSRDGARVQFFVVGHRVASYKGGANACVRCVRDEPGVVLA